MYERSEAKTRFYNSSAWRRLSQHYAKSHGWICEHCHNKNVDYSRPLYKQLHCHHKIEIAEENLNDPEIALNEENLVLLCQKCHNHFTVEKEVLAPGLEFDENGMVRKRSERHGKGS